MRIVDEKKGGKAFIVAFGFQAKSLAARFRIKYGVLCMKLDLTRE
jgi:hypothetical protein